MRSSFSTTTTKAMDKRQALQLIISHGVKHVAVFE